MNEAVVPSSGARSNSGTWRWWPPARRWWVAGPIVLALFGAVVAGSIAYASAPGSRPPVLTLGFGYVEHGSSVDDATLAWRLPPPPLDAISYEVRTPLHNSDDVVKKRWLWVPDGTQVVATKQSDGTISLDVPIGTKLWKEFYLQTDQGLRLVERRILAKVSSGTDAPSWAFYASYTSPYQAAASEVDGSVVRAATTSETFRRFTFDAQDWLPNQAASSASKIVAVNADETEIPYVFPGLSNCAGCHGGAPGAYSTASSQVLAFGLHPRNLTADSLARFRDRGWMVGTGSIVDGDDAPSTSESVETDEQEDARTATLVGYLRNNCASCHNASPHAMGAVTAFRLDPNANYTTDELAGLLGVRGKMMGDRTLPLVTPGDPSRSEIMLRVQGLEGRRRMPPIEGGVPEPDRNFVENLRAWIENLPPTPASSAGDSAGAGR